MAVDKEDDATDNLSDKQNGYNGCELEWWWHIPWSYRFQHAGIIITGTEASQKTYEEEQQTKGSDKGGKDYSNSVGTFWGLNKEIDTIAACNTAADLGKMERTLKQGESVMYTLCRMLVSAYKDNGIEEEDEKFEKLSAAWKSHRCGADYTTELGASENGLL